MKYTFDFENLKYRKPELIGINDILKSSVLIPLIEENGQICVLFEIRNRKIEDQPGDICFPGGKYESGELPEETAVRETCEELLIKPEQIEIIGPCDILHNDNLIICPYAGYIKDYKNTYNQEEVDSIFTVPLEYFKFTEPERYKMNLIPAPADDFPYEKIAGGKNYKWRKRSFYQLFYSYENKCIWGMTARIIYAFSKII